MEKDVVISIKGIQKYENTDPDVIELVTAGRLARVGESYALSYQESELTGLDGTLTTIQVEGEQVTLMRVGSSPARWCSRRDAAICPCTIHPMAPWPSG